MVLRKLMGIFTITLIVGAASLAMAGVPDVTQCTATRAYTGPEFCVLFNVPDGNGNAFTDAVKVGGGVADATITLIVKDGGGVPIVSGGEVVGAVGVSGLPEAEDIALASMGARLVT